MSFTEPLLSPVPSCRPSALQLDSRIDFRFAMGVREKMPLCIRLCSYGLVYPHNRSILAFMNPQIIQTGISFGTAIAIVCSWSRNQSILWAILHGFLSWVYVIYFAITRR